MRERVEDVVPPSAAELAAIEVHLASLPLHSGASVRRNDDLDMLLVESPEPGVGYGYGAVVRWPGQEWTERITAFEHAQRNAGAWPSLLVAQDLAQPADLDARLAARGWASVAEETVLWTRRPSVVPHLDPALRIESVTERTAPEHEALERRIFGLSTSGRDSRIDSVRAGLAAGTLRGYLVRSGGEAVAVARLSLTDRLAGLYGVGVAADRRRQGLGTLVTTVATRAGLASGHALVWLSVEEGNEAARRMYEGLGFRPAFTWRRWLAPAS
jgi:ribosomal protein S18 acetylase RimI-like enzyme